MKRVYIILVSLLFVVTSVCAENSDLKGEFEAKLSEASSMNRTIVARFTQSKSVPGIKSEVVREGDFYYDNSGQMAMIYDEPAGDKVIMNGEDFTIVVGGKRINSSSENPMMAQISYMMQASMSGEVQKLGRGWELDIELGDEGYVVVVRPTERRVKRYVTSMTMIFETQGLTLATLKIDESSGGYTTYDFLSKEINREIDQDKFIP